MISDQKSEDFYRNLREKVKEWYEKDQNRSYRWVEWVMLAPDFFHLLIRLVADPEVPISEKAKLGAVIAYFISPLDFLPELFIGPTGFLDDIVLSAFVLNTIINTIDETLLEKHWAGEKDALETIKRVIHLGDKMVGSGLFKKLKTIIR